MKTCAIAILLFSLCLVVVAETAPTGKSPLAFAQSASVSMAKPISGYMRNVGLLYIETVEGAGNIDQLQALRALEDRIDISTIPQTDKEFYESGLKRLHRLAEIRLSNWQAVEAQVRERLSNSERQLENIQEGIRAKEREHSQGLISDKAYRNALANSLALLRQGQSESQAASEALSSYKVQVSDLSSASNKPYVICDNFLRTAIKVGEYERGDLDNNCELPASQVGDATHIWQQQKACPSGTTIITSSYGAACIPLLPPQALPSLAPQDAAPTTADLPFVGCASDGQGGPIKAPTQKSTAIAIPAAAAQRLAYYKAEAGVGVLAPLGWHCFGVYGSNGQTLYVTAAAINTVDLFSTSWRGFTGSAIQISSTDGGTSGRFSVARTIARVFPAHMAFVQRVITEDIKPASSFPYGPYAGDTLNYRSEDMVEFGTPPYSEGLGTASRLQKNGSPISGVVILFGQEPILLQLSVRLTPETNDLTQLIIQQTERETAHSGTNEGRQN